MYNGDRAFGFINGDDGNDYFFHISSFKSACQPSRGLVVSFQSEQQERGLVAKNVSVPDNILNRPQFLDFGSIRIKLNNIKSYGIAQGDAWYAKMYRLIPEKYITRKSIFGKVHKKLVRAASTEATDSAYPIDIKERTKSWYSNAYGQWRTRAFTEYYAYNRSTRNYCKLEYTFCLDDNGDIVQTHVPLSNYDLFMQPESYLYVTTFQGENYKWFEHHVEFDIHEKCLELDKYMR